MVVSTTFNSPRRGEHIETQNLKPEGPLPNDWPLGEYDKESDIFTQDVEDHQAETELKMALESIFSIELVALVAMYEGMHVLNRWREVRFSDAFRLRLISYMWNESWQGPDNYLKFCLGEPSARLLCFFRSVDPGRWYEVFPITTRGVTLEHEYYA